MPYPQHARRGIGCEQSLFRYYARTLDPAATEHARRVVRVAVLLGLGLLLAMSRANAALT